ncbi:MAG: histidine phosphatase family protein [Bacteroidetes bacterium]|nr:histidine phosphatase family protein [Bacteroidota bacterium]
MLCYFVRHGETEQSHSIHESERKLSDFGLQQAKTVGLFISKLHPLPELILTSPLLRAQQTATVINEYLHLPVECTEYLLNGVDIRQLFNLLNANPHTSLVLVGHQPSLGEIISILLSHTTDIEIQIKPCTLVAVDIPKPVKPGNGKLLFIVPYTLIEEQWKKE